MGIALEQVPELRPPLLPSQRHRYSLVVSAIAASLALPEEQPFLVLLLQTPFTGFALAHLPEFRPPWIPSQRHRYSVSVSPNSASLGVPETQAFLAVLSQTPFTGQLCELQDRLCVSIASPEQLLPPHASVTVLLLVLLLLCVPPPQVALQVPQSLHCPQDPH